MTSTRVAEPQSGRAHRPACPPRKSGRMKKLVIRLITRMYGRRVGRGATNSARPANSLHFCAASGRGPGAPRAGRGTRDLGGLALPPLRMSARPAPPLLAWRGWARGVGAGRGGYRAAPSPAQSLLTCPATRRTGIRRPRPATPRTPSRVTPVLADARWRHHGRRPRAPRRPSSARWVRQPRPRRRPRPRWLATPAT